MNWSKFFHQFSLESSGYVFMWLILFFLVIVFAIIVERWVYLWVRSNVNAPRFWAEIQKLVGKGDYQKAIAMCKSAGKKALPQVMLKCLTVADTAEAAGGAVVFRDIQDAVDEASLEIMPKLKVRTNWLSQLGNIGTLTGLMGTIFGLIQSFEASGAAGGGATALAAGISIAMFTTLWGLCVAIPALLSYTLIDNKTQAIIDDVDEYSVKLINLLTGVH
ncbi:MAG: MotA/TolQ/ExbB proton channel family protein [Candidatus Hatepunaea meridiana]|nr:MotA/TolQ/ExbB proton channel family protein [Candidatus Hatepunaea meridiana]